MMLPDFSKIGGFFEEHVEKMVLLVVGALCAWLLITRVILSPNMVSYDGKNISPAALDEEIYKKAQLLRQKLNEPPEDVAPYDPRVDDFVALLDSAVTGVDTSLWPVAPSETGVGPVPEGGVYGLPRVGDITDVDIEHIRTVAYVPLNVITPEVPYDKGNNEPNDIDFVTVSAKYDIAGLFERFRESFIEYVVDEQYADPCLAKPVFAAVQLQRQTLDDNGTWGAWQDVPRTRIDQYRRLYQIVEHVKDLPPGGLKVQLLQYDNRLTQIDLLQPEAYQIASANEEWFPPELHREFLEIQRRIDLEEKMEARETEKQERARDSTTSDLRSSRRTTRTRGGVGSGSYGGGDVYGGGDTRSRRTTRGRGDRTGMTGQLPGEGGRLTGRRGSRGRTGGDLGEMYEPGLDGLGMGTAADRRAALRRPTVNTVYYKFDEIRLTRLTQFEKLREPLVFWHHDDTIEPGKTYRYRIRLGVFNPLAGTDKLAEKDKAMKDQVILWSDFSDVTKPVEIMERLYFFANSVREMDKAVTVQVSRLALGRWYSHDFVVRQGELIGDVIEPEPEKPDRSTLAARRGLVPGSLLSGPAGAPLGSPMGRPLGMGVSQEKSNVPETVDCTTGAVMVDAAVVNDWSGRATLRARNYYDMLYSYDGISIEHMPVGSTYWEPTLQSVFSHIARKQREPHEPFKGFGTTSRRQGMGEGMDEYYDEYMGEEMYMEEMMGGAMPY
ncbi:MAG: hypothetical protein JSW66_16780 [Phycisphaerales bacterium]|nr:MAG: hypothetical protein JSW66_16780 [Phycisphaerales bacterium]